MGKIISDQDRNAFTYCLTSLIAMSMLGFTITMAQYGGSSGANMYDQVYTQVSGSNSLYVELNSSEGAKYNDIAKNYTTTYSPTNVFDPLSNAVNWIGATGKLFSIIGLSLANGALLFVWANAIGGMLGWVISMIALIWEISVGYYILAFILPRLRR